MPSYVLTVLKDITLNLDTPNDLIYVRAKQYDAIARRVNIKLMYNNEPWIIPDNLIGIVRYVKPDRTVGMYDTDEDGNSAVVITPGLSVSNPGSIAVTLARQVLTAKGTVKVEISLYSEAVEKLTTFAFPLVVEGAALGDLPFYESDNYFNFARDMANIARLNAAFETATQQAVSGSFTIDKTLSISGAVAEAKSTGDSIFNSTRDIKNVDLLWPSNRNDAETSGITFTWSADKKTCYASGTATATARNLFTGGANVFPRGISPGKTYIAKALTTNSKLYLLFYYFVNGVYSSYATCASPYVPITIPSEATGVAIYIAVSNGTILSETESITVSLVESNEIDENIIRFNEELTNSGSYTIKKTDLEKGSWVYSSKSISDARCRCKFFIPVKKDMTIEYQNTTCDIMVSILETPTSTTFIQDFSWRTNSSGCLTVLYDGFMVFAARSHDNPSSSFDINDYTSIVKILTLEKNKIDIYNNTLDILYELEGKKSYTVSENDMEQGGWGLSTDVITKWETPTRLRNKNNLSVYSGEIISYSIPNSLTGYILISPRDTSLSRQTQNILAGTSGNLVVAADGYLYISVSKTDTSATIYPSDYSDIEISIKSTDYNSVLEARSSIPGDTDLNDVTDFGVYVLTGGNTYDHMPSGSNPSTSHYLIVYKALSNAKSCIQQLIPLIYKNNYIYQRIGYSGGTWEPWKLIGSSAMGSLPDNSDLNDITDPGTYILSLVHAPYLNAPDFVNTTSSYLIVVTSDAQSSMSEQIILPYDSSLIYRRQYIYGSGTWGEWYETPVNSVNNNEFLSAVIDSTGKLLESQKNDGKHFYTPIHPDSGFFDKDLKMDLVDSKEPLISAVMDSNGSILEATTKTEKQFNIPVSFKKINWTEETANDLVDALKDFGVMIQSPTDWSDESELSIPEPRRAVINITGIDSWPTHKDDNYHAWLQFWDCQGNYFKKPIVFNAQGQSSLRLPKKSGAIDLFSDTWDGESFKLRIGKWVPQDSFHLKAYHLDYFKGVAVITYKLMNDVLLTRNFWEDRPWKKALIDYENVNIVADNFGGIQSNDLELDNGARNFPDGFPCIVMLNGEFYGLYSWQLKKHRDNYHMTKKEATQIHLDGIIGYDTIFGKTINWNPSTAFEIRNPKDLYTTNLAWNDKTQQIEPKKYDGDANSAQELIDDISLPDYYDPTNKDHKRSKQVKQYLKNLSQIMLGTGENGELLGIITAYNQMTADPPTKTLEEVKALFETYFDVDNLIDYQIVSDIVNNIDGFRRNWQWTTYDGVKWYINPYDVDMSFGAWGLTTGMMSYPPTGHTCLNPQNYSTYPYHNPGWYLVQLYPSELEARYAYLRSNGTIDANKIINMLNEWVSRYSVAAYDKEYKKWPDNPCHSESVVNSQYWELVDGDGTESRWDPTATYQAGDRCKTQVGDSHIPPNTVSQAPYYTVAAVTTVPPSPTDHSTAPIKWNYHDSIYRFSKWIIQNIENMDALYNYSSN